MVRNYETTFIINPQSDDATIEKHVGDIKDIITTSKGTIINENHMGTRRLAYEINKLTQGYYASFLYEAPSEVLPLLEHHFKVNEAYIRDLTIRLECDPQEYLKQQDPFGKHGSDRDSDRPHSDRSRSDRPHDSRPQRDSSDAPAKAEAAPEKVEVKEESAKADDAPADDKPSEDKA